MKPITREWIEKAEADFRIAARELRVRKEPSYDGVCFHAQQCAEKYLKARLQEASIPFSKTHDLELLMNLLLPVAPQVTELRLDLKALTACAVDLRYPGQSVDKTLAREAFQQCVRVRNLIRQSLGLPDPATRNNSADGGARKSAGKTRRKRR